MVVKNQRRDTITLPDNTLATEKARFLLKSVGDNDDRGIPVFLKLTKEDKIADILGDTLYKRRVKRDCVFIRKSVADVERTNRRTGVTRGNRRLEDGSHHVE